jgi:hypothetical protein
LNVSKAQKVLKVTHNSHINQSDATYQSYIAESY